MTENTPKSQRKYKSVTVWDAEHKKYRTVNVKPTDFANIDEFEVHVRQLREDAKARNRQLKEAKHQEKLDKAKAQLIPMAQPAALNNLEFARDVNINLDPNTGNSIVIYGSSKRGKTYLMMHIYDKYFMSSHKVNTLFSGNPQLKKYHKDKELLVSYGFSPRSAKYIKLLQYINVKTKNKYDFTVLLDDIIDQKYAPILNNLVLTYRNSKISTVLCLQYTKMLSKPNRSSVNHTIVFGSNTAEMAKDVIDLLLKPYLLRLGLVSYRDQAEFYRQATVDHGFIYIDNIRETITLHRLPAGL